MRHIFRMSICLIVASTAGTSATAAPARPSRPNIVVIVADDLGFSDLGAFGAEIRTPNLDALAHAGVRLTDFHSAPTCSPTRSMLLSGTDNHTAGVGAMAEARSLAGNENAPTGWGYEGVLTPRVATLAERLRNGGYFTTMAGKWHLGLTPEQDPHARGFQTSFALLQGGHNHFGGGFGPQDNVNTRATYTKNGIQVGIPDDFYSSDYFTTQLMAQLAARPKDRPFFAYLAFTAPHSPLQAPAADIARYKGRYDAGWVALREERLARMKVMGVISKGMAPAPVSQAKEAWDRLTPEQKKIEARKMEIYAAMVDRLDQNVGRLIGQLRKSGAYSNTIFFFTSDNGPAAEGEALFGRMPGMSAYFARRDNSIQSMGSAASAVFYGPNWAEAASAPYRLYKGVGTEGGTRVAAFISYHAFQRPNDFGRAFANVMDIVPTILEATSVKLEPVVDGRSVAPVRGRSMLPFLKGASVEVHNPDEPISFELSGHRAVRQGDWKLLLLPQPIGDGRWALFNLASDPAEQNDLSAHYPERKRAMLAAWDDFAKETRIAGGPGDGR